MRQALAARDLIGFRCHGHDGDAVMQEPGTQLLVLGCRGMTQVNNMHHRPQGRTLPQVGFHHGAPTRLHLTRDFGVAITGEVDEQEALVHHKKIDCLRFPRRGTRLDQILAVHEGIDQGRFPHVRTPGKRHFRERLTRVLRRRDGTSQKFCA